MLAKFFESLFLVECSKKAADFFMPVMKNQFTSPSHWHPFYEARFGVEIFIELYDSTLLAPVSS